MRTIIREQGISALLPYQVLEFLLFYAVPYKDTKEMAHTLLDRYGTLDNVFNAPPKDLMQVKGITQNAVTLLNSLPDIFKLYHKERVAPKKVMRTEDILPYLHSLFAGDDKESLYLISFDYQQGLLHTDLISQGNETGLHYSSKKIVETALRHEARKVIIAHNHPNGYVLPSEADIQNTAALNSLLSNLDIVLLDHIIIGEGKAYSFYLKTRLTSETDSSSKR